MNTVLLSQPEIVARLLEIKAARSAFDVEEAELLTQLKMRVDEGHNAEPEAEPESMPDFSIFKPTTCRLLTAMYEARERIFSQEDIRDVIGDEYASETAVKLVILKARRETEDYEIEIKNIHGKGYQLIIGK